MMRGKRNQLIRSKRIIGLDLDGAVLDHTKMRIRLAKKYGYTLLPRKTSSEIIDKAIPSPHRQLIQYFIYSHPELSQKADFMPGVRSALARLRKERVPFFIISRRKNSHTAISLLKSRGFWPKYFNEKNVFFVNMREEKNAKAKELGITHFADDEAGVLAQLTNVQNRFLFDPHRAHRRTEFARVKSWPELLESIFKT